MVENSIAQKELFPASMDSLYFRALSRRRGEGGGLGAGAGAERVHDVKLYSLLTLISAQTFDTSSSRLGLLVHSF